MKKVNDNDDIKIKDGKVNDVFIFPDKSRKKMIFKGVDRTLNYDFVQIRLIDIRNKSTTWLKFQKNNYL